MAYGGFAGVCVQERVRNASSRFFPGNGAKKTLLSNLHIYHHCSENLMRFWNLLIDRPGLVNNLKTCWKLGENLVNFQNLVNIWCIFQNPGKRPCEFPKTWWKPGYFQNLVKTWWICKTWWKLGECQNLVKTWWKPGEFTRCSPGFHQTNERNVLCTEGLWYNACCIPHPK